MAMSLRAEVVSKWHKAQSQSNGNDIHPSFCHGGSHFCLCPHYGSLLLAFPLL